MKPLKVLILITKANWGGAQRYVYDVATNLPKDRFSVEVMAGSEGKLTEKLRDAGVFATGDLGLGRDVQTAGDANGFFKLISLLRAKRPDILHLNSSKIGGLGALAGRIAKVPKIIFTVHGWAFNESRPLYEKLVIKFLAWFTLLLSHEVVVVSNTTREQARNWPWVQDKMTVIRNAVRSETSFSRVNARLELTRMDPRIKAAIEGVSEKNLVWIGTIAELHPTKGHPYAIRAVADCIESVKRSHPAKKIIYTIMSDGQDKQKLQSLIDELGLGGNIFLMGHVDLAKQYLKAFDIFVLASLSEALGMVILEAGMAGVPVVATSVGGIPEVVDDMHSGILVQSKNMKNLAHAILFTMEHPKEAREYAQNLKTKVEREFNLDTMMAKLIEVYVKPQK